MSVATIARLFLRLGFIAFGGPTAHIALMHEEVVRRRGWIQEREFMDALGVTNLIPGPNSSEMAIHIGHRLAGQAGALAAGVCFAAPAVAIMTALSAAYFTLGGFAVREDLFQGLQPVVIAVLAVTLWRLRGAIRGPLRLTIALGGGTLTVVAGGWEPVWLLAGGAITLALWALRRAREVRGGSRKHSPPGGIEPTGPASNRGPDDPLTPPDKGLRMMLLPAVLLARRPVLLATLGMAALPALAWVFFKTGALLFGGGYVLIPLLEPEVVGRGWLTHGQFLDGIALGQATPGPIVTASAFVGYGVAGVTGALVATVAIYLPAFVSVMAGTGPFLRSFRDRPVLAAAVSGINAAALGAIGGAGVVLARVGLAGPLRAGIALVAFGLLLGQIPTWAVLVGGAAVAIVAGMIWSP